MGACSHLSVHYGASTKLAPSAFNAYSLAEIGMSLGISVAGSISISKGYDSNGLMAGDAASMLSGLNGPEKRWCVKSVEALLAQSAGAMSS